MNHRFPLPVSHVHARLTVPRPIALAALLGAFLLGLISFQPIYALFAHLFP